MALPDGASCPWPVNAESCGLTDLDPEAPLFISSVAAASSIMARLSAYTIGTCEAEIRPLNICPECRTWCCGGADSLYIKGPFGLNVWDVTSVALGPDDYAENTWRYDKDTRTLWRVPPDVWPTKDEKWSNAGEGEAFVVTATIGVPPDAWALDVAARLVKELYLSCTGAKCRLPSNVTQVTSQGVTIRLRDEEVNTFIPELAAWTHAVNPHGARLPGMVMSPEVSEGGRGVSNSGGGCRGARRLG
jgi:hypothetical protein